MKIVKPLIITLSIFIVILLIVALITPPVAKNYIVKHSKEMIGRQIHIEGLYANIFTGFARISGFRLLEQNDRDTFVAFDTLQVKMSLFRLLASEIRINQISLTNPQINLQQKGASFNFDDLLALGQTDSTTVSTGADTIAPTEADNMAIALYNITIRGGHIVYNDLLRNSVWQMNDFGLQIPGVYFSGQSTDVGINLNFTDGGHLQTAIRYDMQAGNYDLKIDLGNFSISPVRPYLTDFMNINSIQGILNASLNIKGSTEHVTDLSLQGNIGLHAFSLKDTGNKEVLGSDSLYIDIENINLAQNIFHFRNITVDGIQAIAELYPQGNTFSQLMKSAPADTTQQNTAQTAAIDTTSTPNMDFRLDNFRVNNSSFVFNDNTLHTPFSFSLENINMLADHLTLNGKNKARINSTLKNGGTINVTWEGNLENISNTDLMVNIKNLDLKTFTPYSLQYFGYPMTKGILSFTSINDIKNNILDGRNNLNIAKCEVANKQKQPKPEYNIPLKTALYLIKDVNDQIKIDLPVQGNINSPEFSYKKIIFKTLTNLLIKVAVSPVNFLANSLGFSPDKLKNIPFEATQNDFTPEQLTQITQLSEIIKAKPEMTLVMEQFINLRQSKAILAQLYVKKNYYLQLHPEKTNESLQPIDYSKILEIDSKDLKFLNYVRAQVSEELKDAYLEDQILSLSNTEQLSQLTQQLTDKRNQALTSYLTRQGVPAKCIRISTASEEKLSSYSGKNQYTVNMIFQGDEPDADLMQEQLN